MFDNSDKRAKTRYKTTLVTSRLVGLCSYSVIRLNSQTQSLFSVFQMSFSVPAIISSRGFSVRIFASDFRVGLKVNVIEADSEETIMYYRAKKTAKIYIGVQKTP